MLHDCLMSVMFVCQLVIFYEIMCSLLVVCRHLILFMKLTRAFTPFSELSSCGRSLESFPICLSSLCHSLLKVLHLKRKCTKVSLAGSPCPWHAVQLLVSAFLIRCR